MQSVTPRLLRVSYPSRATGTDRGYLLYLPTGYQCETTERWPLLLVLHGNGERGDGKQDLDYLLVNGPLHEAWIQKRELPFIIVAPQLPMYGLAQRVDYLKERTRNVIPRRTEGPPTARPAKHAVSLPMQGALADERIPVPPEGLPMGWPLLESDVLFILDDVIQSHRVDPSRLYLTGMSYGAFGAWHLASRHPNRFAAMVPVVGYPHPDLMPPLAAARLPVWCFAGGRDQTVPIRYFYPGLNRLEALGHPDVRFSIEADMGHDVWTRVYSGQDVYDWMLSHRREPSGVSR